LFGLAPAGPHAVNLLFHAANTVLLFLWLSGMTGALGRSAFVALIFGLHPLHVESVAWIAERKDVLSTFFWMLTLWAYVHYVSRPGPARYLFVFASLALGLMAKPMLVTLPFVLLLLDFWPLARTAPLSHLVREKLPPLALSLASSVVTFVVQRRGGAVVGTEVIPLGLRAANAAVAYLAYVATTIWPARLAIVYPYAAVGAWQVAGAGAILIALSVLTVRAGRRRPYLPVGWLWYAGTLVPVLGLVQVGSQPMADRYTYVPLIGLFVIVAWGVTDLLAGWRHAPGALAAAAALVLSACMAAARAQVLLWKDSTTLFAHALAVTRDNYVAHYSLGVALTRERRTSEAIEQFTKALEIRPSYASAHNNLGVALGRQGKPAAALAEYAEAVRIDPDYAEARYNLANQLFGLGRIDEAIVEYGQALRVRSDFAEAHNNLGVALMRQGRSADAVPHFSEALRIRPDFADAGRNLATALSRR